MISRRSGRTTAMIDRAIDFAKTGKTTLVLAATHLEKIRIERIILEKCHGQKIDTLSVMSAQEGTRGLRGREPPYRIYIDHHVNDLTEASDGAYEIISWQREAGII